MKYMLLRGGIFACMLTNVFSITTKVCGPNYPTYMYFVPRVVITQKRKMSTFQKSQIIQFAMISHNNNGLLTLLVSYLQLLMVSIHEKKIVPCKHY